MGEERIGNWSSVRVFRLHIFMKERMKSRKKSVKGTANLFTRIYAWRKFFLGTLIESKKRVVEMTKSCPSWKLKSCWAIRSTEKFRGNASAYLLEHEVTVSGGPLQVEVVAKFIHSISESRTRRGNLMRGGLVSLTIRKGRNNKESGISRLIFRLKRRAM